MIFHFRSFYFSPHYGFFYGVFFMGLTNFCEVIWSKNLILTSGFWLILSGCLEFGNFWML